MKTYISTALLREQLKRFWLIGILFIIAYFLMGIMPIYLSNSTASMQARDMVALLQHNYPVSAILMIAPPFLMSLALFPYHTSSRAAAFFYSMPVKKKQLFWTNMAAAAVLMVVPLLLFCVMLLPPVYTAHGPNMTMPSHLFQPQLINTFPAVAGFFARMVIGMFFYYGVFALASAIAGSKVVAVILCVILPLTQLLFGTLIDDVVETYVFGFGVRRNLLFDTLGLATNPMVWDVNVPLLYAVYLAAMAVLIFAAYKCSHKRKHERTGDSVVFTGFKRFFIFALSLYGASILGSTLRDGLRSHRMLYFGGAIGFVLSYIIAQMIAEKTLNIRHKLKVFVYYGGVMVGLILLTAFFVNVAMLPYVNRIPDASEIVGVSFGHNSGTFRTGQPIIITDPAVIAQTRDVHNWILNNRRRIIRENRARWGNHHTRITYHLANGTNITRDYATHHYFRESGMFDLLHHRSVRLSRAPDISKYNYIQSFNIRLRNRATQSYTMVWIHDRNHIAAISVQFQNDHLGYSPPYSDGRTRAIESMRIETNWYPQYEHLFWERHRTIFNPRNTENWLRDNGFTD